MPGELSVRMLPEQYAETSRIHIRNAGEIDDYSLQAGGAKSVLKIEHR